MGSRLRGNGTESSGNDSGIISGKKNPLLNKQKGIGNKILAMTYFRMVRTTLSLARSVFTAEFEMDSGGTHSLWSPGKPVKSVT